MVTKKEIKANLNHAMKLGNLEEVTRWHKIAEMNGMMVKKKKVPRQKPLMQEPVFVCDKVYIS